MALRALAAWLLRALAAALLAAAMSFMCRKAERFVATGDIPMPPGDWFSGWTPLEHVYRQAFPWEERAARYKIWTKASIYQEPLRRLPFTVVLSCEPGVSVLMDRFDWQLVPQSAWDTVEIDANVEPAGAIVCGQVDGRPWKTIPSTIRDPRTVWAAPHALHRLLELAERDFDPSHNRRAVVFSGTEMPMSRFMGATNAERAFNLARLRKYFDVINVMTKDIMMPGVGVAPMGLCWGYMITFMDYWIKGAWANKGYVADRFISFEANISLSIHDKSKFILATRGLWAGWLDRMSTLWRAQRLAREGKLFPPSNSSTEAIIYSVQSRLGLQEWSATPEAQAAGVDLRSVDAGEWWSELPKYKFLLNPLGSAIQTSKMIEALIVLTIPVIERRKFKTFDSLIELGFPLVLVDGWSNVTRERANAWWEQISPRLESFRRNCLTVDGYWGMFTGTITRCV